MAASRMLALCLILVLATFFVAPLHAQDSGNTADPGFVTPPSNAAPEDDEDVNPAYSGQPTAPGEGDANNPGFGVQSSPIAPSDDQNDVTAPRPVPLVAPDPNPQKLDKRVRLDGHVRVYWSRWNDFEWRYRIENGSDEVVSSFSLVIPNRYFDSRFIPDAPRDWAARREPASGQWRDSWFFSFFACTSQSRLRRGHWMEVALRCGQQLFPHDLKAAAVIGTTPQTNLVFPDQSGFFPLQSAPADRAHKETAAAISLPFPALSFLPFPSRTRSVAQALDEQSLSMRIMGKGVHYGNVFQMTFRTPHNFVATIDRGTVFVPSLNEYDVMICGEPQRLIFGPQGVAVIGMRGYSITYGRKAPPPRTVLHDLIYRIADEGPIHRQVEAYRRILERAPHLAPTLLTPLRDRYYDTVVQYAIWRAQRLMEGNPLTVRDVERDMSFIFYWRRTLKGPIRVYMMPLQIYELAKKIWTDTDVLLHDDSGEQIVP